LACQVPQPSQPCMRMSGEIDADRSACTVPIDEGLYHRHAYRLPMTVQKRNTRLIQSYKHAEFGVSSPFRFFYLRSAFRWLCLPASMHAHFRWLCWSAPLAFRLEPLAWPRGLHCRKVAQCSLASASGRALWDLHSRYKRSYTTTTVTHARVTSE
jgi:hypothetical protein